MRHWISAASVSDFVLLGFILLSEYQNYSRILQFSNSFLLCFCTTQANMLSTCTLSHNVPLQTTAHISHLHCICRSTSRKPALSLHVYYYTCTKFKFDFCFFFRRTCPSGGCPVGPIWRLWAMHWSWTTSRGRQCHILFSTWIIRSSDSRVH